MHDSNAGRTCGVKRELAELTLAEIKALDAGAWKGAQWRFTRVPTLAEVLATMPDYGEIFIELKSVGAMVGSGGLVVMNKQTCIVKIARFFMQFTQNESCGKCVPCREGTKRMLEILDRIVANEGRTDQVMNAARAAGATGGTVLHGKGTGSQNKKFYNVSIAAEKEVILMVAQNDRKAAIMQSVLHHAGPDSEAGAILFSLPVSEVAGFGLMEDSIT